MEVINSSLNHGSHHDDEDDDADVGLSIVTVKVITMVVLFVVSFLLGMAPYFLSIKFNWMSNAKVQNLKTENRIVVGLLAFGGGVLLCTTFMHLLPEVNENILSLQRRGVLLETQIFLAPLLMCAGFFFLYFLEEMIHLYLHKHEKSSGTVRTLSIRHNRGLNSNEDKKPEESLEKPTLQQENNKAQNHSHGHSHVVVTVGSDANIISTMRSLLIVLALSTHELFEGLAIGLESTTSNVWYLFAAVASHKFVIAFCVGVEQLCARTKKWQYAGNIGLFAVVSPVGISIGILLLNSGGSDATEIASVIAQGIASGTLMYVVFFEVLKQDTSGLLQFFSSIFGFGIMLILQFFTGHDHSHGQGNNDCEHEHEHSHGH